MLNRNIYIRYNIKLTLNDSRWIQYHLALIWKHRRTSRGGEGGCSPPPSHSDFWIFSGKTLMIRANVLGRKFSKRLSKPVLKATFSDVCLVKTELKSNDLRIQVFVLEKPYIVFMCIVEIHEMKQNPSKRRPTNSDKTCWDTLQKYLFFALTLTKMLSVAN